MEVLKEEMKYFYCVTKFKKVTLASFFFLYSKWLTLLLSRWGI